MYYKIRLSFDHDEEGCAWVEEYINVNSRQEAEECIPQIAKDYKIPKEYDVDIQETSIDEMIECEKEELWSKIRNHYIHRKYDMDTITIRQFADVQKELKKDKEKINAKNNCIDITSSYFDSYLFISNRSNYGCCIYGYKLL